MMTKARQWISENRGLIGYAILSLAMVASIWTIQQSRREAKRDFIIALTSSCERLNALSDQRAKDIYANFRNLDKNGKLLGIKITPQLRAEARRSANNQLKHLTNRDCSVIPPAPPVTRPYKIIKARTVSRPNQP